MKLIRSINVLLLGSKFLVPYKGFVQNMITTLVQGELLGSTHLSSQCAHHVINRSYKTCLDSALVGLIRISVFDYIDMLTIKLP